MLLDQQSVINPYTPVSVFLILKILCVVDKYVLYCVV